MKFNPDTETFLNAQEAQRRDTILGYYTEGEGAIGHEPLAVILGIKDHADLTVDGLFDCWIERLQSRGVETVGLRSQLRKDLSNTVNRIQRHRLISSKDGKLTVTNRGRQYLIGAIASRASTLKSAGNAYTLKEICELCSDDELPGSLDGTGTYWSAPVGQALAQVMTSNWFQQAPRNKTRRATSGGNAYA